jgi:hypothetical protein
MAGRQSGEVRCVNELIVTAGGCEEREEKEDQGRRKKIKEKDQGSRSVKEEDQGREG